MSATAPQGPGIRFPPPVLYGAALLVGVGLNSVWPVSVLPDPWRYVVGVVLLVAGGGIVALAFKSFRRAQTPFDVRRPAAALVTDGPYRLSRNPGYVALSLAYAGVALLLNNAWVLLLIVPLLVIMDRLVVSREERHLEAAFGEEYQRYKSTVRRWL